MATSARTRAALPGRQQENARNPMNGPFPSGGQAGSLKNGCAASLPPAPSRITCIPMVGRPRAIGAQRAQGLDAERMFPPRRCGSW